MGEDGGTGNKNLDTGEQAATAGAGASTRTVKVKKTKADWFPKAHPPEVKQRAKDLYMQYTQRNTIAATLGIPTYTVDNWVKKGNWHKEREKDNKDVAAEVLRRKAYLMSNIAALIFEALSKAIAGIAAQKTVSLNEGYTIAMILAQLDKVARLTQGEPTDVVKHEGSIGLKAIAFKTEREIRDVIGQDPMTRIGKALPKPKILEGEHEVEKQLDRALSKEVKEMRKDEGDGAF